MFSTFLQGEATSPYNPLLLTATQVAYRPAPGHPYIFEGVSLTLNASEMVTLMGPNGSGKTTMAKTLLGLLEPTAGSVERRPGLRCGYLPQSHTALHGGSCTWIPMSAEGYLSLHPQFQSLPVRQQALALADFKPSWMALPWNTLSGGQRQRLFLARALMNQPELLILDEPSSHLDLEGQQSLQEALKAIKGELQCALLVISHDLHTVMAQSDRVLCFDRKILCTGSPAQLQVCEHFQAFLKEYGSLKAWSFYQHMHHPSAERP